LEDRRADLAARVAELEAEVERRTGERDEARKAGGEARISENKAEHARVSMSLRVTKLEADRDALAQRVAEAVREACAKRAARACLVPPDGGSPTEGEVAVADGAAADIRAIDLRPIVAAAIKEGE
jgi:chromosome segregation ATPase